MSNRAQWLKCFALVGTLVAAWALLACRLLASLSPDYATREPGAGLTRPAGALVAGVAVGLMVAGAARLGSRARRPARSLVALTALTLALTSGLVLAGVVAGAALAGQKAIVLPDELAEQVPARRHGAFVAAAVGHLALGTLVPVAGVQASAVWLSRRGPNRVTTSRTPQPTKG